jgi:hypothetical protein
MMVTTRQIATLATRITAFLASRACFYVIMGIFVASALWFALSAVYPMAFDEDFHMGVISIYARQWSPFLDGQPVGGDPFGALAVDPSYLFHYMMSFPYSLLTALTSNEATQIIVLRLINIGFFAAALVLLRRVLLRAGASPALAHTCLLLFILIPIVPQLAAHVNYDNLIMLLFAWLCLLVIRLTEGFKAQRVDAPALALFVIISLYTSVVKYAALPLLVGAVLFLLYMAARSFKHSRRRFSRSLLGGVRRLSRPVQIALFAALLIGSALFAQRYVVNVAKYHTPVPDCGAVLSVEKCSQYGPWGRDYRLEQEKPEAFVANPFYFMKEWARGMVHRLFFAVSGSATAFTNYIELPVPSGTFWLLSTAALVAIAVYRRDVFAGHPYYVFFVIMSAIYLIILWFQQYSMYQQTSLPVAINGRYLLPILPLLMVVAGRAFALALRQLRFGQHLKPLLAAGVVMLFLQGGGILTYLLRADSTWLWPHTTVRTINEHAKNIVRPVIIEGDKYKVWY